MDVKGRKWTPVRVLEMFVRVDDVVHRTRLPTKHHHHHDHQHQTASDDAVHQKSLRTKLRQDILHRVRLPTKQRQHASQETVSRLQSNL